MSKHLNDPEREENTTNSQAQSVDLLDADEYIKRLILRRISHIKLPIWLEGEFHVFGYNSHHHRPDVNNLQEICDSADSQLKFEQDLGHVQEAVKQDECVED